MTSETETLTLIKEKDYGTPAVHAVNNKTVTLEIDGREVTVPEGTSIMRAAADLGIMVPKLCATDNLDPFGSCRLCLVEIEGRKGTPASCTTPVAPEHQGHDTERSARPHPQGSDGALYLRPSARLPHLRRQWRLRAAGHGRRGRPARRALRLRRRQPRVRAPARGREPAVADQRQIQPLLPIRAVEVHRLLALRARLPGSAGHLRAHDRRARLCLTRGGEHGRGFPGLRMRLLRRLRAGLPHGHAHREVRRRPRPARAQRRDDLRLLRRRLLVQGRDAGRARRAHDALQGRRRQRGS